ncbi:MAG TPA: cytochrome d ubiquinol oxidase subunit II [Xanthomonadales bacterium]|nr:cytochrome d ubiquinol oxidase subunit II [Xanthomonadales bacterium]
MNAMEASNLALFWAGVLSFSILVYVVLDGFDLGVGILFGTTSSEDYRSGMMGAIAPYWDGNETWLVVVGAGLYAAFPKVYAVFLGAFYLPVLLLLFGLIFRGVAFEFRFRSHAMRPVWDLGFSLGSTLVAFVQGAAIGAMMRGIPVVDGQYAGNAMGWLHPFAILTGAGLVFGYALLGAGWLALKTEGDLRSWALARIPWLAAGVLLILGMAFATTLDDNAFARNELEQADWHWLFPAFGVLALVCAAVFAFLKRDALPFVCTVVFFISAYLTLGFMYWPFMIPYTITVTDAAAPDASLEFLYYGAVVVLPIILIYTIGVYWLFRGKVRSN